MEVIGQYPLWYVPGFSSGWVLAVIASTHVLFSHLSVGASFLLAYWATVAYRENRPELFNYVKNSFFALVLTSYVIGSLTGPGIWFSSSVANPRGIGELIHNFVWVWAAEWVFFVGEVTLVYMMVYAFGRIPLRTYTFLSWGFALYSWATMLIIVGILSFMLSPGARWAESGLVFQAFYNPSYFPHLLMRTGFMLALGALLGIGVASRLEDAALRARIVRQLSGAGLLGLGFAAVFLPVYLRTLPDRAHTVLALIQQGMVPYILLGIALLALALGLFLLLPKSRYPAPLTGGLAVAVLALAIFPVERTRETIRKPYVAGEYLYSNGLIAKDVPAKGIKSELPLVEAKGLLALHPFVPAAWKKVDEANLMEAGRAVALVSCSSCHSLEATGPRPIVRKLPVTDPRAVEAFLRTRLSGDPATGGAPYMPKLVGTPEEIRALSAYLAENNRRLAARQEERASR